MEKTIISRGKPRVVTESDLLNVGELAQYLGCSRWTVQNYFSEGYEMEFGSKTSASHCLDWLRQRALLVREARAQKMQTTLATLR